MTIKASEIATVVVEGRRFDDWESVFVQHRWSDAFPVFRFTASERDPIPNLWQRLQFKPQDECAIYLGGHLAIAGVITTRQAAYDSTAHGVMLEGKGLTWFAARGSIMDKTGSFDKKTFEQAARQVIAPFGVGVEVVGTLDATPFEKLQVEPGETLWNFLERIARPRGVVMGSDKYGNFLLIGDHSNPVVADLQEGDNIKRAQFTFTVEWARSDFFGRSQTAGGDAKYGTDASEQEARVGGILRRYSPLLTPSSHPVWNLAELQTMTRNEAVWNDGTEITASITVYGWFRSGTNELWRAGDLVNVYSPMAPMQMAMAIDCTTFTQDSNSGTLTQLDLVAPWLLKDKGNWDVGRPGVPQEPGSATPNTGPPAQPQSLKVPDAFPDQLDT